MQVSHNTLKFLAAIVWYIGPIILFNKGAELANDAHELESQNWGRLLVGSQVSL